MKTAFRMTIAAFGLVIFNVSTVVVEAQFNYTATNGTVTITKYTGSGGAVTIPSTIGNLPVTTIGAEAFSGCESLTSVAIPDSVTNIGGGAFPYSTSLGAITVDPSNPAYSSVDGVLFDKSQTTLIQCPGGKAGSYAIPNSVKSIEDAAFCFCRSLTSVTIPNSVLSIGVSTFQECGLTNVTIPNSVTSIREYLFEGCRSLTSVTIGNSVTNIVVDAFFGCPSLTEIIVDALNPSISTVAGVLFDKSQTTLITYPKGKAGSCTVPSGVTSIGDYAFWACTGLTNVTLPNSVTNIGKEAFYFCSSLTSVTILDSVTSIGDGAFQYCASLTSVTIPNSVNRIGDNAFSLCVNLIKVMLPNGITSIGDSEFFDCTSLTSVTIPSAVTTVLNNAFNGCTSLTGVYFQGNAPSLGLDVFANGVYATVYCLSGTAGWGPTFGGRPVVMLNPSGGPTITGLPQSVSNNVGATVTFSIAASGAAPITYQWWKGTTSLPGATNSTFTLTNVQPADAGSYTVVVTDLAGATKGLVTLTVLGTQDGLTYTSDGNGITITGYTGPGGPVAIPDTIAGLPVTSIGAWGVSRCTLLTNVTIPDSITNIGDGAFYGCDSLTYASLGNGVSSIGAYAFNDCSVLNAIVVDALNSAYSSADGVLFNKTQTTLIQCPGAKTGTYRIPDGAMSIEDHAFEWCNALTNVTIPDSVISIGKEAFSFCNSLRSVTLGNAVASIGDLAFNSCWGLTSLTIPNSVTNLGTGAFSGCGGLANVTIGSGLTSLPRDAFFGSGLVSVTIPNGVTSIGFEAFSWCSRLTSVSISSSVTYIADIAFEGCLQLARIYFWGNAPEAGGDVFKDDNDATVYHLPNTTGWGATYAGRPTAVWNLPLPTIWMSPLTQTAEAGSTVDLQVQASGPFSSCLWYFNDTNLISCCTTYDLEVSNVQFSQSGAYTAVITNAAGAITSAPAMLQVIAAVEHRPVAGLKVTGETGSLLNIDYTDSLSPAPNWTTLGSVSLTSTSQYWFEVTSPLPAQRFYRAWQTGTPSTIPSLDLHLVPAVTLVGNIGDKLRLDYINQFGPIDAWMTLDTVTLTNTSQFYFDVSTPGQPQRLYRLVQVP